MAAKAGRGSDQFVVRLPDGLREKIREASEQSGRSMNAEFVARIEASFDAVDMDALRQAALVAESLRKNLAEKNATVEVMIHQLDQQARENDKIIAERFARIDEMENQLREREKAFNQEMLDRRNELENELDERRRTLEQRFQEDFMMLSQRRQQADEYAGFTIAREQQFIDTIKALTGENPPPVSNIKKQLRLAKESKKEE